MHHCRRCIPLLLQLLLFVPLLLRLCRSSSLLFLKWVNQGKDDGCKRAHNSTILTCCKACADQGHQTHVEKNKGTQTCPPSNVTTLLGGPVDRFFTPPSITQPGSPASTLRRTTTCKILKPRNHTPCFRFSCW